MVDARRKSNRPGRQAAGLPEDLLETAARRFRALGTPSRLRILNALMGGPLSVGDLVELTNLEQSNVSRQVTELETSGCVARSKAGRNVLVEIIDPTLRKMCDLVCNSLRATATRATTTPRGPR